MHTFHRSALLVGVVVWSCNPGGGSEKFALTIEKAGAGHGAVTATDLDCGATCTKTYASAAVVTLTATPESGSTLDSWAGCDGTAGATCLVGMTKDRTVTATFAAAGTVTSTLTVQKTGTGTGTVTGTGIDCGATCSHAYSKDTAVQLTAVAGSGSVFSAWTGCDSTAGAVCTVTVSADRTVSASFTQGTRVLVSDDITTPTTWTTGTVYEVTKAIKVKATLTVQPGVLVLFDAGAGLDVEATILVDGQSSTTPVTFTSAATTPAGGDWGGITLRASGSTFNQCAVLYAGANGSSAVAISAGKTASLTHCTFAHHKTPTNAISAPAAVDASDAAAGTVIADNLFFDNRVPLAVSAFFSVPANTFDNAAAAPSNPQPNLYNGVVVSGCQQITSAITWAPLAVPYVIGDPVSACNYLTVANAGQLTIGTAQAKAVVKFFPSGRIGVDGNLVGWANFTSIKDDARGGDTNGDGATSTPVSASWDGISLNKDGSSFDGAGFFYGGGSGKPALDLGAHAATVKNCTFAHHRPTVATFTSAPALDASDATSTAVLGSNTFFDNTVPLVMNTTLAIDDTNTFQGAEAGGTTVGNTYQAIQVRGCGQVTSTLTWSALKVPLLIGDPVTACNYLVISGAGHLTLADGVVVKFFPSGRFDVQGLLTADATTQIVLTSVADDAHGGDTNADGSTTAAKAGDWEDVQVSKSGSSFTKVSFLYGGGNTSGASTSALRAQSGIAVSVVNSVFAHTRPTDASIHGPAALDVSSGAPSLQGTVITGNRFFDNVIPLSISANQNLDDSNFFDSGVAAALLPSHYNGILVEGCGAVTGNTTWSVTKVPLVVGDPVTACNYMTVPGGGHLTLGDNVTMKFFIDGRVDVSVNGLFTVPATAWLTSIADDHVNDTNADGSATAPATGDWNGVKRARSSLPPVCDTSAYLHFFTPNNGDGSCSW